MTPAEYELVLHHGLMGLAGLIVGSLLFYGVIRNISG